VLDFNGQLDQDFNDLENIYKVTFRNEEVRQNTIKQVKNCGKNNKENYRRGFKLAAVKMSKKFSHIMYLSGEKIGIKNYPVCAGISVSIVCKILNEGKRKTTEHYEISCVEFGELTIKPTDIESNRYLYGLS